MQQTDPGEMALQPRLKRRKIQMACNKCRNRKTRCDGHRPACLACLERGCGSECIYEPNATSTKNNFNSLSGMTGSDLQVSRSTAPQPRVPDAGRNCIDAHDPSENHTVISGQSQSPATGEQFTSPARTTGSTTETNRVNGLATLALHEDDNMYGESSTIAFVRHVLHDQSPARPEQYTSPTMEAVREMDESQAVFPRRQTADDYIKSFWEFVHPVFPILDKSAIMSKYKDIWSSESVKEPQNNDKVEEVTFSANLNLVFALGCQFSSLVATDKRMLVANEFYQRSRKVFVYDILDTSSLSGLQMLLLTGVYLQSTEYAERCWNTVGLAIRTAQNLGLHSETSTRQYDTHLAREIRRRIWHVCVTLDRLSAMTFGRPAMIIRSWDVPIPQLIDDEYLQTTEEPSQPTGRPSRMGLFVYSTKLYDILDKILVVFYTEADATTTPNQRSVNTLSSSSIQDLLSNVLDYNRQLDTFYHSIPEYLRFGVHSKDSSVQLQAQILICRFLYTRVILLRPLLLRSARGYLRSGMNTPNTLNTATLDKDLADYACNLCVKSAQELAENLLHNIANPYRISPWHTVYLSFAAAIVLIAAQRSPAVDLSAKRASIDLSLDYCVSILVHHKPQIQSAHQAIQVLQKLRSQYSTSSSHTTGSTNEEQAYNATVAAERPPTVSSENFSAIEPLQEWWNEILPNRTELNSESWFSHHLTDLDWLDGHNLQ